jgi:diaminohydroxyphosphoribosylaminopyrimidine deaminase / 5-amino-6-(5-phosphoribosylamino)uracil reductase
VPVDDSAQAAMHRALALGETVRGQTSPNPAVGAVLLDADGLLIGEGATGVPGEPHAEIHALRAAGPLARGATLYATLEPCSHTGRTPPCAEAIIAAGVARVVYAVDDPNPVAAGGAKVLRAAGIDVVAGVGEAEARAGALRPWLHSVASGRPFVTWKYAATMDGRVAAADGSSRWISSAISRADAHRVRAIVDAIMVGSGTVFADDPSLTVRTPEGELVEHQPLRVVLDRRHRVPLDSQVFDQSAETVVLDTAVPRFALKALHDRGVRHLLLEGGPTLAGGFIEARCVDEIICYLAPKLLGAGPAALGDAGITSIDDALDLSIEDITRLGDDIKITARPIWAEGE